MALPRKDYLNENNFKFLSDIGVGKRNSLTIKDAESFVSQGKIILRCAKWDKNVEKNAFEKVVAIMDNAVADAKQNACEGVPFTLPMQHEETPEQFRSPLKAPNINL